MLKRLGSVFRNFGKIKKRIRTVLLIGDSLAREVGCHLNMAELKKIKFFNMTGLEAMYLVHHQMHGFQTCWCTFVVNIRAPRIETFQRRLKKRKTELIVTLWLWWVPTT